MSLNFHKSIIAASRRAVAPPGGELEWDYLETLGSGIINNTTQVFAGINIGAAHADRQIFLVCSNRWGFGNSTFTAASIAGNPATRDAMRQLTRRATAIFRLAVPTGTTADIGITTNGAMQNVRVSVVRVIKASPTVTGTREGDSADNPHVTDIAASAGGFIIASCLQGASQPVDSPTIDEIPSFYAENNGYHGLLTPSPVNPQPLTFRGTSNPRVFAVASYT